MWLPCATASSLNPSFAVLEGAGLYGEMPASGIGEPAKSVDLHSIDAIKLASAASNEKLLKSVRGDPLEEELHRLTVEDAKLGRISCPRSVSERGVSHGEFHGISICPRYVIWFTALFSISAQRAVWQVWCQAGTA